MDALHAGYRQVEHQYFLCRSWLLALVLQQGGSLKIPSEMLDAVTSQEYRLNVLHLEEDGQEVYQLDLVQGDEKSVMPGL